MTGKVIQFARSQPPPRSERANGPAPRAAPRVQGLSELRTVARDVIEDSMFTLYDDNDLIFDPDYDPGEAA